MPQLLRLEGPPAAMGRQHGEQIALLRPLLVQVMEARLAELRWLGADHPAVVDPARAALETHDRPLLEFLAGLADSLELPPADLLAYTLSSYLRDLYQVTHPAPPIAASLARDGCSTWAAAAGWTVDGAPILAKNRDYHADHIPLQVLAQVRPMLGYGYLCLGSAGSPHVFSSGINERGLAVADTHVLSTEIGPGLPRFSLMRAILERHDTTLSALDYLRSVPHMGAGTLILADARGHLAVCESGATGSGYLEAGVSDGAASSVAPASFLASTNHFVTPELAAAWVEDEPALLQGNSPARRSRILSALSGSQGSVSVEWAQALMSAHGSLQDALCRHPFVPDGEPAGSRYSGSTISSVIFLPRGQPGDSPAAPALWLAAGQPCLGQWECRQVEPNS